MLRFPQKNILRARDRRNQAMKRGEDRGNAREEPVIKIYTPKEPLQSHLGSWTLNGDDRVELLGDRDDARRGDLVAQERDIRLAEDAFVTVDGQAGSLESVKDLAQVNGVSSVVLTGNQDVVQIDKAEGQIPEDAVH